MSANSSEVRHITIRSDALVISHSYDTYDVLAVDESGGEDNAVLVIIGRFTTFADARSFVNAYNGPLYIAAVRPPQKVYDASIEWLRFIMEASRFEGMTIEHSRKLY